MWNKIKNILIFLVIAGVLVGGYVLFMQKPDQAPLVSTTNQSGDVTPVSTDETSKLGQDFLNLLFSVKSINLDAVVFETPIFGSLKDSSIILISDGSEGRPNPFAPIGSENSLSVIQAANDLLLESAATNTPSIPTAPNTEKPQTTPVPPKQTN
ncbi:MAG: hypothetical protein ACKOW9_02980 [Candidatus Paceibacterota bacterium]